MSAKGCVKLTALADLGAFAYEWIRLYPGCQSIGAFGGFDDGEIPG